MMLNGRIVAFILGLLAIVISLLINMDLISNLIAKLVKELAFDKWTDAEEMEVIEAWRKIIIPSNLTYGNILIGLNSCLDLIVPALAVFKAMNLSVPSSTSDSPMIADKEQFVATFGEFFRRGHAAERSFVDRRLFAAFVAAAESVPDAKKFVGGNAALMAQNMLDHVGPDTNVTLIGPVGPQLQQLLASGLLVPPACRVTQDEVHLILEYAVGDRLGALSAPVANRFIVSHDEANTRLLQLPQLSEAWRTLRPGLVVLSGVHMLEALPLADWTLTVERLAERLAKHREEEDGAIVHLELASMTDQKRMFLLAQKIFPLVDSLGLNEQELSFLGEAMGGPRTSLFSPEDGQPGIGAVADLVTWLLTSFEDTRLSRVHFHSLTFHLLGARPARWRNSAAAAAAGARTASARACGVTRPEPGLAELRLPRLFRLSGRADPDAAPTTFVPAQGVLEWRRSGVQIVMAPVLVCRRPVRTVGLGDSVSAAGLIFSEAVR